MPQVQIVNILSSGFTSNLKVSSADKLIMYKVGAKVEKILSIVLVPGSILVPDHDVQVKQEIQVGPVCKPVKLNPVRSTKGEI